MSDPGVDVLEFALREHFEATEPRDVTWRVLTELQRPGREARTRRRLPRSAGVAAAALLIATVGAMWLRGPGTPRARASVPVAVYDASGEATPADHVPAGRIALATAATRVELPGGTAFEATSGTVFLWSPGDPALELFAGTVDVQARGEGLVVGSATGTLELAAHARARFEVTPARKPVPRTHFARSLAMNLRLALSPTVTATLLAGSATLLCGGPPHVLALAQPTTVEPGYTALAGDLAREDENPFEHEPGVWDLFEPHDAEESTGVETVTVGPHPHSLLSDVTSNGGGGTRAAHFVLKYEAGLGRITGSMIDSFGGPIGVIQGKLDDEGGRVLELYRIDGRPFDLRLRMSWIDDDERRTFMETKEDGEWRTVLEQAHRRRPGPEPKNER